MDDCLFCRIVRGEIPSTKVADSATCLAFRDIAPKAPVHVLVIPRTHYDSANDVSDAAVVGEMVLLAKEVARAERILDAGYRMVINTGVDGGQTVGHLHLHVLGGRGLKWPPG
ncbi:MAG: histidine triad nucleotide-binding protein [Gemmatimonadota bacterium]|nr:histidine triad nucleotide-binding protein [Gemmatimonadota bacterium]